MFTPDLNCSVYCSVYMILYIYIYKIMYTLQYTLQFKSGVNMNIYISGVKISAVTRDEPCSNNKIKPNPQTCDTQLNSILIDNHLTEELFV